ncbi:DNA recombination protein RmuC [Poseidonocella pacifica]|nr:DNA recombination protein RmuC [Poseidonocella pacifica]
MDQAVANMDQLGMMILGGGALVVLLLIVLAIKLSRARSDIQSLQQRLAVADEKEIRASQLREELEATKERVEDELERRVSAESELEARKAEHAARLHELRGMKAEMEEKFANLANGVLQKNSDAFLGLVTERFKAHQATAQEDLEGRKRAIEHLVKPLDEKLGVFDKRIGEIEKARNEAYGAIRAQVTQLAEGQSTLGQETRKLVQALRAPKTRGRWGEMQLRQVFDMAGMAEHVDYDLESHMETDGGARRPDAIVHIPGGKSIVVDAKTPLEAYLDALDAETPEAQTAQIARHARQVRDHVKTLSSKAYHDLLHTTPDFVVMFIPGETFVAAAAEVDPGLMEFAFERKVLIATPTTLMALVKAIAYGWQQEKMAENAVEVQKTAKELYDRLSTFAEHMDGIGKALTRSVSTYNKAVGSLESRVLPSVRKFEQMGVVSAGKSVESPSIADSEIRVVTLPGAD